MAEGLKDALGRIPMAADLYDAVRGGHPRTRYNLEQLAAYLPAAVEESRPFAAQAGRRSRLLLFATLHYWIEQAVMVGLTLRGKGHEVTIAYLPYSSLDKEINSFDLRRQDLYTRRVLQPLNGWSRSFRFWTYSLKKSCLGHWRRSSMNRLASTPCMPCKWRTSTVDQISFGCEAKEITPPC